MPRDYKHRAQPKSAPKRTPSWLLLLTGYLLGAMSVGLLWLKIPAHEGAAWIGIEPESGESAALAPGPAPRRKPATAPNKPRFDFYTMLPEMEVVVPEEELEESPPATTPEAGPATRHLLQVGSFRKQADAERVKAQLALLGYGSHVQQAQGLHDAPWFRVRTSPFTSVADLRKARDRLAANGFHSLVIQVPR